MSYEIELIDPKAILLLEDLAKLNLIRIREIPSSNQEGMSRLLERLRSKESQPLSEEEIEKEVEEIRERRYKDAG